MWLWVLVTVPAVAISFFLGLFVGLAKGVHMGVKQGARELHDVFITALHRRAAEMARGKDNES